MSKFYISWGKYLSTYIRTVLYIILLNISKITSLKPVGKYKFKDIIYLPLHNMANKVEKLKFKF